jgi:hypothetical protein
MAWRRAIRDGGIIWAAQRVVLLVVGYLAILFVSATHKQERPHPPVDPLTPHIFLHRWAIWDTHFYLDIAQYKCPHLIDAAFFPLYPLTIRVFAFALPGHWLVAALIASNLAALGAFIAIGLLAEETIPALRSLTAYPLAFFLAVAYSDALFLLCATSTLLCARKGSWGWAALWTFLAALDRPFGIALVLPLAWEYYRQGPEKFRWRAALDIVALSLAVPAAIGLFSLYCWLHFHDPLAYIHAQKLFWNTPTPPWQTIGMAITQFRSLHAGSFTQARVLVDIVPLLIAALITVIGVRQRPVSFTLYLVGVLELCLLAPIVGSQFPDMLAGVGRFLLAAVPIWLDLGRWSARWPWLDYLVVSGGFMIQAVLLAFVLTGGWLI